MKKKGFTLIELLVVIAIIAMLLAILMPALNKVKKIAQRVVCGTNLKGLGTAQTVYANDYEDQYTLQGQGNQNLAWASGTSQWQRTDTAWSARTTLSLGASLYLLVREADVSPKSFVCPSSTQTAYDGKNDFSLDLVELWDFGSPGYNGTGPENCVSYAFHMPYKGEGSNNGAAGNRAASATKNASFAVMADRNPFLDPKLRLYDVPTDGSGWQDKVRNIVDDWSTTANVEKWMIQVGNAHPHDRDGQNVTFGDGHSSYEKRPDVGEQHDNIYLPQNDSTVNGIRIGVPGWEPTDFSYRVVPLTSTDSLLVNDSRTTR